MVLGKRRFISELSGRADSTSIHASDSGGECDLRGNSIRRFRRGQRAPRLYPGRRELRQRPPARWVCFERYTLRWVFADRAIVFGVQTERRGDAGPLGACSAARTSPAALFVSPFGEGGVSDHGFFLNPHHASLVARLLGPYSTSTIALPVSELLCVSLTMIF
jgi:hypothetical protein